jgi:hypothetical protein
MNTVYGEIPNENISQYINTLIGKTFKILPLFEENSPTLTPYIKSYQRELVGVGYLFECFKDEPKFIALLATIEYLANASYDHDTCKAEVFKCTNLISEIHDRYFGGVDG